MMQRDPTRPEDILTLNVPDHGVDALRFLLNEHLATSGAGSKAAGRQRNISPVHYPAHQEYGSAPTADDGTPLYFNQVFRR